LFAVCYVWKTRTSLAKAVQAGRQGKASMANKAVATAILVGSGARPAGEPPVIINKLRWPGERRTFWLTVAVMALAVFFFTTFSLGTLAVLLALLLGVSWLAVRVQHAGLLGSAIQVSRTQVPRLGRLFEECAARVRPPLVQGFVAQSPALNAYAFGLSAPQAVVLYSGLVQCLDDDELRFVIGHEFGHILFQHTRVNSLLGGLAGVPGLPFLSGLAVIALLSWSRCAEFSADRVGLLACGRLDKAQSAIVKLMIGPHLAGTVRAEELEEQAAGLERNPLAWLGQLGQRHPFAVFRLRELRRFAAGAAFQQAQTAVDAGL